MSIVIIGAGLAGATAATELREQGYEGPVVLLGSEEHPPYERPPLSKSYLLGEAPFDKALVHPLDWYAEHDVDLRLGVTATAAGHREPHRLHLGRGPPLRGAAPRHRRRARVLPVGEQSGTPVAYLRTKEDSDRLREAFAEGRRIVVVGGGWIGLEAAAAARTAGAEVTLYEMDDLPLQRVLGPPWHGPSPTSTASTASTSGSGREVTAADLEGADLVVAGIGVTPRVDLAAAAGLDVADGVLVDARLRTSVPSVLAVGDIADHAHPRLGRRIRVEHWDTAIRQAKVAAHNLGGRRRGVHRDAVLLHRPVRPRDGVRRHASADDEVVVHGSLDERRFRAYWMRGGQVVAAMHANDWDASDAIREAVDSGRLPDEG